MGKSDAIYKKKIKRPLDFVLALCGIIVLSPLLIFTMILIKVKLGSPILFKQKRPGLDEKIFTMYKFRTMTNEKDKNGNYLPDSIRLTSFGNFLRSTSIDELPSLFNILKGDMSFVGPRPLLIKYLPYYTTDEKTRHTVRPGLTGLSQVNGRNNLNWDKRLELDIQYVNNVYFITDVKIILKTLLKVFKREDIVVVDKGDLKDLDKEREGLNDNEASKQSRSN